MTDVGHSSGLLFEEWKMMPTITMLLAVLAGPATERNTGTAASSSLSQNAGGSPFATLREARAEVTRVLRESNRTSGRDPADTAPAVIAAHEQLSRSEKLPIAEHRRLQAQLHTRLTELQDILRRRELRASSSHSGGVAANAQNLIDLIQTTIAPDTWDINGGNGTIFYFPNR